MKRHLSYFIFAALIFIPGACNSFDNGGYFDGGGVTASMKAPVSGDGFHTRALDADFGFTFLTGDRITVFNGNGNEYMSYALTPSKGMPDRASFNVEAFSLKDGLYYAVYPSLASLPDPRNISLPLTGQIQEENNSTEHLSAYDYCLASAQVKDNSGYFQFEHKVCWLKIVLPAGRNNCTFRKLTLSAGNGVANSITLNALTGAVTCSGQSGDALSLELGDENGITLEPSDTLVAYMCVPAGTYSDIVLTAESPSAYRSEFRHPGDRTLEAGRYYLADVANSNIVPLREITEYGIYNCDQEERTMSWIPPVAVFRRGEHQISWYSGAGITSFAFFQLGTTEYASFRINSENLVVGEEYNVDIASGYGLERNGATFKLIRKTDDTAWLFDTTDNLGCVIKIDE